MKWFTAWRARRRWQQEQAPREIWVHLLDESGRRVASTPTVVNPTDPGWFTNATTIPFTDLRACTVVAMQIEDANGNVSEVPLG